jgi:hypothetical protein
LEIYSLLRPQEINTIILNNYIVENDGLWVFTLIKTNSSHFKAIFIPSTNGEVVLNPIQASFKLNKNY